MDTRRLLEQLITIRSAFHEPPYELEIASFIEEHLKQAGFHTRRQSVQVAHHEGQAYERYNVLAEKGEGNRSILFYGHMDTVPAASGWETDPWSPVTEGDRLYGLGAVDMKAGLTTLLEAFQDIEPQGCKLKLAFLVDEENVSRGAHQLIQSDWMRDVAVAIVPESATSDIASVGPRMMTLGRRGRVTIRVDVPGKSAHAGQPERGISALYRAARIAVAIEDALLDHILPSIEHPQLGKGSVSIRTFHSSAHALSVPDTAFLLIDRHLVPPETSEQVCQEIIELVERMYTDGSLNHIAELPISVGLADRETPYMMPYTVDDQNVYVQAVEAVIKQYYRTDTVVRNYGKSVADENYIGASVEYGGLQLPVIVIGPKGAHNHSPGEWVSLQSIMEVTEIYRSIVSQILGVHP